MLPHQLQELLEKHSRGACSPEEEQFIHDWYHNIGKDEDTTLRPDTRAEIEERLWQAIEPAPSTGINWLPLLVKVAAVVAIPLLVGLGFYLNRPSESSFHTQPPQAIAHASKPTVTRVYNDQQTTREVTLPDGSLVVLRPGSEIHFNRGFTTEKREVYLKGEAFFKVHRDTARPFMVYANEVVTKVLGTSFNIKAYENEGEVTVAVKTGKVSVYAPGSLTSRLNLVFSSREVILTPNQQIVYNRTQEVASKQLVEKPEIILPNSNLFRMQFENTKVIEILEVLEENYGVKIQYEKHMLRSCRLTTSMSDEGLYERIEVICKAIGASYSITDAVITIKSKGC